MNQRPFEQYILEEKRQIGISLCLIGSGFGFFILFSLEFF